MTLALAPDKLDQTLGDVLRFLLSKQDENGSWRDFLLPAGLSNSWVTGYVGQALVKSGGADALAAARRGWAFLQTTSLNGGGWSYNPSVPGDADSTLWGLRLAHALGEADTPAARAAQAFLDRHRQTDGGISTYAEASVIRAYIGAPDFVPFDGWTQSHDCVTAAAANLPSMRHDIADHLLVRQLPDGSWPAYFWFDREYTTGEAVCALTALRAEAEGAKPQIDAALAHALDWLRARVAMLSSHDTDWHPVFALSCAGAALALHRTAAGPALDQVVSRLADWQRDTGGFGPSARLRVPLPMDKVPDESAEWRPWRGLPEGASGLADVLKHTFNNFSPDHRGVFSAATALTALSAVKGTGS